MTTRSLATLLALGLAALASPAPAASPLAVMPFTYVGRIVDSTHTAFDGTTAVELRLKDLSGKLLAKCTTYTSETSPYNYRLDVPMATAPAEGCATYGQVVAIELVDANGVLWAGLFPASKCAVGKPGDLCRCDIVVAADANANGIADEYEDYLAWRMWNNGVEGPLDPDGDLDGDGQSNRLEYFAGTDPLDASDRFALSSLDFGSEEDGVLALTFLANAGRVYSLLETETLSGTPWTKGEFKTDPEATARARNLTTPAGTTEYRTIYVVPPPERASGFYKLTVE